MYIRVMWCTTLLFVDQYHWPMTYDVTRTLHCKGDAVQMGEENFLDMATAVSGSGPAVSYCTIYTTVLYYWINTIRDVLMYVCLYKYTAHMYLTSLLWLGQQIVCVFGDGEYDWVGSAFRISQKDRHQTSHSNYESMAYYWSNLWPWCCSCWCGTLLSPMQCCTVSNREVLFLQRTQLKELPPSDTM